MNPYAATTGFPAGRGFELEAIRPWLEERLPARYRIERPLGRGGMGLVLKVHDSVLERSVALKIIQPAQHQDAEWRARFLREAAVAASLLHPNIVPVHDAGESEGLLWYAMAAINGKDLRQLVAESGVLGIEQALELSTSIGQALGYAHARGVVHRDVKPENILVETGTGRAYLCDFGIARVTMWDLTRLATAGVIATPRFAAPESLVEGPAAGAAADQFSMALVAYFALCGEQLVPEDSLARLIRRYLDGWSPSEGLRGSTLTPSLQAVFERALARDPARRYPNMEEWVLAIQAATPGRERPPLPVVQFLRETEGFIGACGAMFLGLGMAYASALNGALNLFGFVVGALAYAWVLRYLDYRSRGFRLWDALSALRTSRAELTNLGEVSSRVGCLTKLILIFLLGALPGYFIAYSGAADRQFSGTVLTVLGLFGCALLWIRLRLWPVTARSIGRFVGQVALLNLGALILLGISLVILLIVGRAIIPKPETGLLPTLIGSTVVLTIVAGAIFLWLRRSDPNRRESPNDSRTKPAQSNDRS